MKVSSRKTRVSEKRAGGEETNRKHIELSKTLATKCVWCQAEMLEHVEMLMGEFFKKVENGRQNPDKK